MAASHTNTDAPKWRRQPDERPEQICRAALDVFAENGFKAATMQEIAEAAGITKGTIYLYFPSKEALFIATLRAQFQDMLDLLPALSFDGSEAPEAVAQRLAKAYLNVMMKPEIAKAIPLVIGEYNHMPVLKQLYFEEILEKADLPLAQLLQLGQSLGLVRHVDTQVAARGILGAFFAFVLTQEVLGAQEHTPMTKELIVETMITTFFRGLLAEEVR